jgi:hypothetical protein
VGLNEQFQLDNVDLGIVLIEVLQSADSAAELNAWTELTGYHVMRHEPTYLMQDDYVGTSSYPIMLVVDAQTMEVIADCYDDLKGLDPPLEYLEGFEYCFELNTEIVF